MQLATMLSMYARQTRIDKGWERIPQNQYEPENGTLEYC